MNIIKYRAYRVWIIKVQITEDALHIIIMISVIIKAVSSLKFSTNTGIYTYKVASVLSKKLDEYS